MRWKYPFQPSADAVLDKDGVMGWDGVTDSHKREERRQERDEASHKPVAKPRVKVLTASKKLQKYEYFYSKRCLFFCKFTLDTAAKGRNQRSAERE